MSEQLRELLADPAVTDVLINGVQVWADRGDGVTRTPITLASPEETRKLAQRLAAACGRRLDDAMPFADGRLADGSRMHAALPPIAVSGPYVSLRTFRARPPELAALLAPEPAELLAALSQARLSFLISGGAGTGKTTVLNAMLGVVSPRERIVVVEDVAELRPAHPHVVSLQTRHSNVEGAGEIGLRELMRQALRMRPDRLIVGECRGGEVSELLAAMNTGHDGSAGTVHANSPADVPARMEALGLLGGIPRAALHSQLTAAVQVVVQTRRMSTGRVVDEVCLLRRGAADGLASTWSAWRRADGPGPAAPQLARLLSGRGVAPPHWLGGR